MTETTILICGDRNWTDFKEIDSFLDSILLEYRRQDITIVEGDCRGADKIAGFIAFGKGMKVRKEPADWKKYGKAAGPIRNQYMLDKYKPDMVVAFHNDYENSKGTKDMCERAKTANIYTVLVSTDSVKTLHSKVFAENEIHL
jgi:hypothetical protein